MQEIRESLPLQEGWLSFGTSRNLHVSEKMLVSARADLLGRLGKSIIFSLLALLHLSHMQRYKMRSQTAALCVTAPYSPAIAL